jgi:hypothetical protein
MNQIYNRRQAARTATGTLAGRRGLLLRATCRQATTSAGIDAGRYERRRCALQIRVEHRAAVAAVEPARHHDGEFNPLPTRGPDAVHRERV